MHERWQLTGKRALVTGATKGIGRAIADELLNLGAQVMVNARSAEDVAALVDQWQSSGRAVEGAAADVRQAEGRRQLFAAVERSWGCMDILINNVGTNVRKPALAYGDDEYDLIHETNLRATFEVSRLAYPYLKQADSGVIVNVSSVAGLRHVRSGVLYGVSKAAMNQMTRNLAVEWAADGIRVNAIAPWYTHTPLADQVLKDEAFRQAVLGRTPLGRIAEPEDVAGAAVFLCLPAAGYITGQCLAVDGGFTINGFH